MTQKEMIIDHLSNRGCLDPLQALREYGIYRLGARIAELRAEGYAINKSMVGSKSRITGKTVYFARYSMNKQRGKQ